MESGSLQPIQAPDAVIQNRPVRPEQVLNPAGQAIFAQSRFDLLQEDREILYSTQQTREARVLRVMFCLPVFWPCLGCLLAYRYMPGTWFNNLLNVFRRDDSFRAFLNNLASDYNLQIRQFNTLQSIILWLNWILGTSDNIHIQITESVRSQPIINVITTQNFGNNTLAIDTSEISDRIVTFQEAENTYITETFDAMVSIIYTNQPTLPIAIYQRNQHYIRILVLYDLRDFFVTGNLQAVINTEVDRLGRATETNADILTVRHYLIRNDDTEWIDLDPDVTD